MAGKEKPAAGGRVEVGVSDGELATFTRRVCELQQKFQKSAVPPWATLDGLQFLSEGGMFDFRKPVWVRLTGEGEVEYASVHKRYTKAGAFGMPTLVSRKRVGEWTEFTLNELLAIFGGKLWLIEIFKDHEIRFLYPG